MIVIKTPKDLAKFALDSIALGYAKSFVHLVRTLRTQRRDEAAAAAFGAVCGYYGRPFKNSTGFKKLSKDIIPETLRHVHEDLIRNRDKIVMHNDANVEINDTVINTLEFCSKDGRLVVHNIYVCPEEPLLVKVEQLIDSVKSVLDAEVGRCLNTGVPSRTKFPPGKYLVNLASGQIGNWFVRADT